MSAERNFPAFITGDKDINITNTPVQLDDQPVPDGIYLVVKAKKNNSNDIYIGNSSLTLKFSLAPYDWVRLRVINTNEVWINGTAGDGVEYISEV